MIECSAWVVVKEIDEWEMGRSIWVKAASGFCWRLHSLWLGSEFVSEVWQSWGVRERWVDARNIKNMMLRERLVEPLLTNAFFIRKRSFDEHVS